MTTARGEKTMGRRRRRTRASEGMDGGGARGGIFMVAVDKSRKTGELKTCNKLIFFQKVAQSICLTIVVETLCKSSC